MKSLTDLYKTSLAFLFCICCLGAPLSAQINPVDTAGFATFEHQTADSTYLMKQYFMCFLKVGPNRTQNEAEAAQIQAAHLAHLGELAKARKICMAGPFGDDGEIRGILIMNVPTLEEAKELAEMDPAVKAGRLLIEIHPWWAAMGSNLF